MILALFAMAGADVECEDGDFEFDWPEFGVEHVDDGYWVAEPVYVAPEPCCWFW